MEATGNPKWQAVNVDIKIPGEVTLTTAGMKSHVPKQKCRGARVHLATIVLRVRTGPQLHKAISNECERLKGVTAGKNTESNFDLLEQLGLQSLPFPRH